MHRQSVPVRGSQRTEKARDPNYVDPQLEKQANMFKAWRTADPEGLSLRGLPPGTTRSVNEVYEEVSWDDHHLVFLFVVVSPFFSDLFIDFPLFFSRE